MEHRLKQQRNKLFLRITLILLVVWLAVSATYCVIRLRSEKTDMQNHVNANFSYAKQYFSIEMVHNKQHESVYITNGNLLEFKDMMERDYDSQLIVIDPETNQILADTGNRIRVVYTFRTDKGTYPDDYGTLEYPVIRGALSDTQYEKIADWLNTGRSDGQSYELVCTRFYAERDKIIPLELSVMPVEKTDDRFSPDHIVETFALSGEAPEGAVVYGNGDSHLNLVPKDFFLHNAYNKDYIRLLTDEQREKSFDVVPVGTGEYVYYATDYLYLSAFAFDSEKGQYERNQKFYLIQYAKKANLLANCRAALAAGVAVLFVFFFVIGTLLCLMIWHTVRTQILQEQKRADLTNALAHDIKTPLFVISGYAYSLQENIDSSERDSYLAKIIEQTEQINSLVHKMLNLSKLDSYKMTLNRTDFDLIDLVKDIQQDFTVLPDGKRLTLTHSGDNAVHADRELLRTALQNLIDNAVRYSLPGSEIRIHVTDKTLTIANESEPLTKTELRQIWQPYVRKDKSRHQKGNGLGLSIVKSILDLHGVKYDMTMKGSTLVFHAQF